ncbi:MAG: L,D-transpeptidase [Trichodesmium sp. St16_bin4-tuft]|uniref:ErfK/YbiS/YcfS/YnhG n=1 Tax=Trichodesmium erythraeum (strain IMS101) TaxID=203124 RepID=Q113G5_TRIEI|nr:L,D-transpeptidase [Trichodesmium sp. ALOHA_ZT_67]MDE5068329.1 L,D-transpeptidase [Trichodesmium sp. St4_bin8_1]MDE5071302.1 L,D-transpeptidase [Trichodesmium sp. St5_bin8]MDE5078637.1 L,D-transpeptidase [Trichodesmium sp. St2_bin6]MDE5098915.1 L,D-transpeptidase [Trichodesmium sp. St16_bin4-tuft]MDE5102321.1 L,D-transpeptidase [Trichodesmium sp. St19_bin2]
MIQSTTNKWLYFIRKIIQGKYNLTAIVLTTAIILFSKSFAIASTPTTETSNNNQQTQIDTNLPSDSLMPKLDQAIKDFQKYLGIKAEELVRVVLRIGERRVYVYEGEKEVASYPVAVGKPGWETPKGNFKVIQMVENPKWQNPWTGEVMPAGPNTALGLRWIGFWTDGKDSIGFHGTPTVGSIGSAASHGCVRMYNEDVIKLFQKVQVGTEVVVEP